MWILGSFINRVVCSFVARFFEFHMHPGYHGVSAGLKAPYPRADVKAAVRMRMTELPWDHTHPADNRNLRYIGMAQPSRSRKWAPPLFLFFFFYLFIYLLPGRVRQ